MLELARNGVPLGVGGTIWVPCHKCNPGPYYAMSWTDPLFKALDTLTE